MASRDRKTKGTSTVGSRKSSPHTQSWLSFNIFRTDAHHRRRHLISRRGEMGSLHFALGILDHGEMFLERWERFGRPSFHVTIIAAPCLFLELSNVIFVVYLKQFQILPVEVRGSDVLGPNTTAVELDAFSAGQFRQFLVRFGVVCYHACADPFYIRAFSLFLGHFPILNFLLAAASRFLDKARVLLAQFHGRGAGGWRRGGFCTQMRVAPDAGVLLLGANGSDNRQAAGYGRDDRESQD